MMDCNKRRTIRYWRVVGLCNVLLYPRCLYRLEFCCSWSTNYPGRLKQSVDESRTWNTGVDVSRRSVVYCLRNHYQLHWCEDVIWPACYILVTSSSLPRLHFKTRRNFNGHSHKIRMNKHQTFGVVHDSHSFCFGCHGCSAFLPIFFAAALFAPKADDLADRANITNEARIVPVVEHVGLCWFIC